MIDLYAMISPNVQKIYLMLKKPACPIPPIRWTSGRAINSHRRCSSSIQTPRCR